jgi:hypothetical protein
VPARPCPLLSSSSNGQHHANLQQQHRSPVAARIMSPWGTELDGQVRAPTVLFDRPHLPSTQLNSTSTHPRHHHPHLPQSIASQLFAMSLFPYLGFLFHLTRSGQAPRLVLGGFYFLLAFVGATIPAGIYAKTHYGTSLANVDWL